MIWTIVVMITSIIFLFCRSNFTAWKCLSIIFLIISLTHPFPLFVYFFTYLIILILLLTDGGLEIKKCTMHSPSLTIITIISSIVYLGILGMILVPLIDTNAESVTPRIELLYQDNTTWPILVLSCWMIGAICYRRKT